jgi:pimeloyl-ACP methyl ester carboxylesterase
MHESAGLARLTEAERAELAQLEPQLAQGDAEASSRFVHLMWSTDFADRARAVILDKQPLYRFPRNEDVFRAVNESYEAVLDGGVEDHVRTLEPPVLVVHGAHDTDPARARQVAELAPQGAYVELEESAHSPWLEEPATLRYELRRFLAGLS